MTTNKVSERFLTFGRAVNHLVLLLSMLQDALAAEHLLVRVAVKLNLLACMHNAVLDASYLYGR